MPVSEIYVHNLVAQYEWTPLGNISVAGSILTTDKTAMTVHALTSTTFLRIKISDGQIALNLRWRGGADADSNVQVLYAMRGDNDNYTRIATLTLITGTQDDKAGGGGKLFVDTITIANEKWIDTIEVINDANNGIAYITLNAHGHKNFLLLSTTRNSTLLVDAARE